VKSTGKANENFEFPDLLRAAYEYLINYFVDSAGKKGGEFYMPAEVSFSANDLNAWLFADGRNAAFADHFRFRTEAVSRQPECAAFVHGGRAAVSFNS
jgi:hypothetical protein